MKELDQSDAEERAELLFQRRKHPERQGFRQRDDRRQDKQQEAAGEGDQDRDDGGGSRQDGRPGECDEGARGRPPRRPGPEGLAGKARQSRGPLHPLFLTGPAALHRQGLRAQEGGARGGSPGHGEVRRGRGGEGDSGVLAGPFQRGQDPKGHRQRLKAFVRAAARTNFRNKIMMVVLWEK